MSSPSPPWISSFPAVSSPREKSKSSRNEEKSGTSPWMTSAPGPPQRVSSPAPPEIESLLPDENSGSVRGLFISCVALSKFVGVSP